MYIHVPVYWTEHVCIYICTVYSIPRNSKLWTPMDCAAATGNDQVVTLLIDSGADVDPTDKNKVHVRVHTIMNLYNVHV